MRVKQKIFFALFVMVVCLSPLGFASPAHANPRQPSSLNHTNINDYYAISPESHPGLCIGITGGSKGIGSLSILWSCNDNKDQMWIAQFNTNIQYFSIQNENNLCLGFQFYPQQGYIVDQVSCSSSSNYSTWTFDGKRIKEVRSGLCLGLNQGGIIQEGAYPILWACNNNADQQWVWFPRA